MGEEIGRLGEPVALAKSFYGKDPEPNQPSILRVTNFWANGTWKGTSHKFGDYWHQDGQFWDAPKPVWRSTSESGAPSSRRRVDGVEDDAMIRTRCKILIFKQAEA